MSEFRPLPEPSDDAPKPRPAPEPFAPAGWRARLLRLDGWLDHAVYALWQEVRTFLDEMHALSNRACVRGWRRALVELSGDGLTIGIAGLVAMAALAGPAFEATRGDWLKRTDLAVTFLDRDGHVIGRRGIRHNESVPLGEMPDYVVKAVLGTEDRRFYSHFGIDLAGTLRALGTNVEANGVVQGGSSLTQQLAKNLFLSNERTLQRKIVEAYLALWLETHLSKDEILKLYLDRAYMGSGTFGIDAAAQYYFGKSVRQVSLAEAAMLAGLFKAPTRYSPANDLAAARARADQVLSNMVEAGFETEGQVFGARRAPATPVTRTASASPDYYLDYAYTEVADLAAQGALGRNAVFTVRTAHDAALQAGAEHTLDTLLATRGAGFDAHQAAMVVMDPDGALRVMVGGRDYGQSQFNRAVAAVRQPGSSFKPFVYTTAMLNGFTPRSVVTDAPICIRGWCPKNFERRYAGMVTLTTALAESINTVPIRLALAMGRGTMDGRQLIIDTAHRMGIVSDLKPNWSLPIGVDGVTLTELTGAYGVFASGGHKATPHAVLEVSTPSGQSLWRFDPALSDPLVIDPPVVAEMNGMLARVVEAGTGRKAQLPGIRTAGKTGTTSAYRDAWFIGFTGNLVGGVWFGNDDYHPMNRMTGGMLPAQAWNQVMAQAHDSLAQQGVPLLPIPGVPPLPPGRGPVARAPGQPPAPAVLSGRLSPASARAVLAIGRLMDDASDGMGDGMGDRIAGRPLSAGASLSELGRAGTSSATLADGSALSSAALTLR